MPKRSAQEKIEYYQYKLRKLANKENKRRLLALQTPIHVTNDHDDQANGFDEYSDQDEVDPPLDTASMSENQPICEITQVEGPVDCDATPVLSTSTVSAPVVEQNLQLTAPTEPESEITPTLELDSELLTALGEATDDTPKFGPNIHPTLAERWQPLLKKGLNKETKEKLLKEYLIPENCPLLQAPKLNAEISAAITDMARNRDKKMETAQQQLGICISAVNKALTCLLTGEDKIVAIKHLSDSCRMLTDLHHSETQTRIKVLTTGLAKPFLNVIQDSERDETLFGNKLSDKIKASKAIEKQGLQIKKSVLNPKNTASTTTSTSTGFRAQYQYQGNWQGPSRFSSNRGGRGGLGRKTGPLAAYRKNPQPPSRAAGQAKPRAATQQ